MTSWSYKCVKNDHNLRPTHTHLVDEGHQLAQWNLLEELKLLEELNLLVHLETQLITYHDVCALPRILSKESLVRVITSQSSLHMMVAVRLDSVMRAISPNASPAFNLRMMEKSA